MANFLGSKWDSPMNGVGATVSWSFGELNYAELSSAYGSYTSFDSPIAAAYQAAVIAAFDAWEAVANIDFTQVTDSAASDIRVGNAYIDGLNGSVLAQARYWSNASGIQKAQLYFDADSYSYDWFYHIALHEIGHTIGIAHADDAGSVMYFQISAGNPATGLTADDIAAAQTLYGAKGTPAPQTPVAPVTPPTAFAVTALDANASETLAAKRGLTFEVRRTGETAGSASVNWRLELGSATAADFTGASTGVVTFSAGETTKIVTILAQDDAIFETDESFAVQLLTPSTGSIVTGVASGTIVNDDAKPIVALALSPPTADETDGVLRFEVTRTGASELNTSVRWSVTRAGTNAVSVADFADGQPLSGEIVFASGETSRWIEIALKNDTLSEDDETFTLQLSDVDGGVLQSPVRQVTVYDDDRSGRFSGTMWADTMLGGSRDDVFDGYVGNDRIEGRGGVDTSLYSGTSRDYTWWSNADGTWTIQDLRTYAPDGRDTLVSIEQLRFKDVTLKIIGATTAEALDQAQSHVLRTGSSAVGEMSLAKGLAASIAEVIQAADGTSSVATLSYQFFTGKIPSQSGMDYLVSQSGPNANNLNSAYYQSFNIENRYINFAVNLGREGEGKAKFLAEYGSLSLTDATKKAYGVIFGGAPTDAKVALLLSGGRDLYFEAYGKDGLGGLGTKAAMVGWLLAEAVKADAGIYARANEAFLTDLADGAQFAVDLIGVYGKPEFSYAGP